MAWPWVVLAEAGKVAVRLRFRDELIQSSTGPPHRRREAFKILDLHDKLTR